MTPTEKRRIADLDAKIARAEKRLAPLREERDAIQTRAGRRDFPAGTVVELTCKCGPSDEHVGTWTVDCYNLEANDYRLTRPDGTKYGAVTYATGRSMRKVKP